MNTKVTGAIEAVFAEHLQGIAKESRKPYNFINLSNGLEKIAFSTDLQKEVTDAIQSGDSVEVEIQVDPWNPRKNKILSIR